MAASGGTATVRTVAISGCLWTAHAPDAWIIVTAGATGNGPGESHLTVAPNGGAARQGTIVVAGHTVVVRQQGVSQSPEPPPPPAPAPPAPTPPAPTPPAPTPPPTPPPPQPPSPPAGPVGRINLEGRLSNVRGLCPSVTFVLESHTVYADQSTEYREGNCSHLENRRRVDVRGQRYSDGRVYAERIRIRGRSDDDDDDDDDR